MNPQENSEHSLVLERNLKRPFPFDEESRDINDDRLAVADNNHTLCSTCASVDFAASATALQRQPKEVIRLRFIENQNLQFSNPSCSLCGIIAWMHQAISTSDKLALIITTDESTLYKPFLNRFGNWKTFNIFLALCVWPINTFLPVISKRVASVINAQSLLDCKLAAPRLHCSTPLPGLLDYKRIKRWLSTCDTRRHEYATRCIPPKVRLRGPSKLIDCRTRRLVQAQPSYAYFALSYVWGQQHHEQSSGYPKNLSDFPATIRDAIRVTYILGCRYLWVDRYCIDQNNSTEKHKQIQQMGHIYNNASLKIIAAAGSSPNHGLPGVSTERERRAPRSTISNWTIDGYPDNPIQTIRNSVWMTRAWTYQEALLSRRRLIFTDEQVYFECQRFTREDSHIDNALYSSYNSMFHESAFGLRPEEIFNYISEYSRRKFTYKEDYLNGFLGIFDSLAGFEHSIHHLFGVPIFPQVTLYNTGSIRRTNMSYSCRLMMGMNWIVKEGTRRREQGFPSWSWVGWSGSVSWATHKKNFMGMISNSEAWVESATGELLSLQSLFEPSGSPSLEDHSLAKILLIESEVFEVKVVYLRQKLFEQSSLINWGNFGTDNTECWVTWESQEGLLVHTNACPFEDLGRDPVRETISGIQKFKVLVTVKYAPERMGISRTYGLLLREIRDGYEVIGHVSFSNNDLYVRNTSDALSEKSRLPRMVRERIRLL
ncbi:hypothetical protein M434DRAFT_395570 [Hypoxylon sp. CO27-5]|nr:hypothetical protein M434DRAFT_395570 [Hypoxylon sp. CO27-5]